MNIMSHKGQSFEYITSQLISTQKQMAVYKFDESSRTVRVREKDHTLVGTLLLDGIRKTAEVLIITSKNQRVKRVLDYSRCTGMTDLELAKEIVDQSY